MHHVFWTLALVATSMFVTTAQADVFDGNGETGFGGALGGGDLNLAVTGSTVDATLNRGPGDLNDFVVIYVDSIAGGQTSTGSFTDTGDPSRNAISGFDGGNRSIVNFAPGFEADYAIAVSSGFAGLWVLDDLSDYMFVDDLNLDPLNTTNAPSYTFDFDFPEIGITSLDSFDFVATYVSSTAFRSNEAIGESDATGGNVANGTLTFTGFETFNATAIPEPTGLVALLGVGLLGLVQRRRL